METATLSSKYQILIPKAVREALELKAGQRFTFVVKDNLIQLLPKQNIEDVRGILRGADTSNIRDRQDRL